MLHAGEMITLKRGTETKPVTRLYWENLKAGCTYGWEEVIEQPLELAALATMRKQKEVQERKARIQAAWDERKAKREAHKPLEPAGNIERPEAPKPLTPQQKANLTKERKKLEALHGTPTQK